jgi:hypothetical protein
MVFLLFFRGMPYSLTAAKKSSHICYEAIFISVTGVLPKIRRFTFSQTVSLADALQVDSMMYNVSPI